MTKIMLVEDDKSLREIYGVRLLAEGYDIVSAGDGEEALAIAIKERPALIISDVMMPKISGFDMLDILRSTTETRGVKVIMMTALSSEEQRARGEQLGADRYLVKSQVGIEDVVRVVHEVLGDAPGFTPGQAPQADTAAQAATPAPTQQPAYQSPQLATEPPATDHPAALPQQRPAPTALSQVPPRPSQAVQQAAAPAAASTQTDQATTTSAQPQVPTPAQTTPAQPTASNNRAVTASSTTPTSGSGGNRVIQPISDSATKKVDINDLLDKELAKEAGVDINNRPPVVTADQERAIVDNQVNQFANQPVDQPAQVAGQPALPDVQIDESGDFVSSSSAPTTASANNQPATPPASPPRPPVAL
ncbi:MAG TPA: response regulator [Candidatus Saccharimonadales bacterium]